MATSTTANQSYSENLQNMILRHTPFVERRDFYWRRSSLFNTHKHGIMKQSTSSSHFMYEVQDTYRTWTSFFFFFFLPSANRMSYSVIGSEMQIWHSFSKLILKKILITRHTFKSLPRSPLSWNVSQADNQYVPGTETHETSTLILYYVPLDLHWLW